MRNSFVHTFGENHIVSLFSENIIFSINVQFIISHGLLRHLQKCSGEIFPNCPIFPLTLSILLKVKTDLILLQTRNMQNVPNSRHSAPSLKYCFRCRTSDSSMKWGVYIIWKVFYTQNFNWKLGSGFQCKFFRFISLKLDIRKSISKSVC